VDDIANFGRSKAHQLQRARQGMGSYALEIAKMFQARDETNQLREIAKTTKNDKTQTRNK
jgi:hypothetical protein